MVEDGLWAGCAMGGGGGRGVSGKALSTLRIFEILTTPFCMMPPTK